MSFKIVETIERGKYVLTSVPESWESQGNLRWPKFKSEKLRRDPYSIPEDNWQSMSCIVKRKNIKSFEEAENELKAMSDLSDTDQDIVSQHMPTKPKNMKTDFNKLAHQCIEIQAQIHMPSKTRLDNSKSLHSAVAGYESITSKNNPTMVSEISEYLVVNTNNNIQTEAVQPGKVQGYEYRTTGIDNLNSNILITNDEIYNGFEEQQISTTNTDILMGTTKDIGEKLSNLETKVDNFIASNSKNQVIITINQEQIMQKLSEISAQFDEFIKRSSTLHLTRTEDSNKEIKKICDKSSIKEFEELLGKRENVDEFTKIYSVVCGKGKGRAINNAYALSDAMFDRNFLKQCSWAGGSRGPRNIAKICFKSYERTIDFFFKIIHESDKQFTKMECESFFKNILRNAKKRCESKQLKRSAQKIRQKKLKHIEIESPQQSNEETNGVTPEEHALAIEKIIENPVKEIEIANQELEVEGDNQALEVENDNPKLFQETEV